MCQKSGPFGKHLALADAAMAAQRLDLAREALAQAEESGDRRVLTARADLSAYQGDQDKAHAWQNTHSRAVCGPVGAVDLAGMVRIAGRRFARPVTILTVFHGAACVLVMWRIWPRRNRPSGCWPASQIKALSKAVTQAGDAEAYRVGAISSRSLGAMMQRPVLSSCGIAFGSLCCAAHCTDESRCQCVRFCRAAIAQVVEHIIRNDGVGGSSPSCGTTFRQSFLNTACNGTVLGSSLALSY